MSFPIEGKERLLSATPTVNNATVTMFGETFRRRDWSIDRRYFCPACLAEDAYHRFYWDIVVFRHCPFHDLPLRCVDTSGHAVPWWSPSFESSPFGKPIAESYKRVSSIRPSIESYTLGRLGLIEKLPVPILDNLTTFVGVFSAIEIAGKLALGGRRETRPPLAALGRDSVTRAGFDLLQKGDDAIVQTLANLPADSRARGTRRHGGLKFLFGWAYHAAKDSSACGTIFTDHMVEVAALREGHTRSVGKLNDGKQRINLTDVTDLSQEFGVTEERIRRIAGLLGIPESQSESFKRYVAFSVDEVRLIRRTLLEFIDRDGAAKLLDIPRPFFDCIVHCGLVRRFIRMNGTGSDMLTEACGWEQIPRYLIRDRDGAYGEIFIRRVRSIGIRDRPTSPRSPWQNAYAERLIGSIRRECLDHIVVFGERHLRHALLSYMDYYNGTRTHLSLNKDAPISRAAEAAGRILSRPILGGLHHQYARA
jgi:hypothetical protein